MNQGRTVFAQLLEHLPKYEFDKGVARYHGNRRVRKLPAYEHFLVLAFAQLTWRESLRDIETCLASFGPRLYHCGFRQPIARSTLADANEKRDWRLFADFAQVLIQQATVLYAGDPWGVELQAAAYALDSTTIDLCLALFPWATFRRHKAAIKLHTLLALQGNFPTVMILTPASVHDVNRLDQFRWEAGSFYVMDRGYLDFARLHRLHLSSDCFVTRAKKNFRCARRYSRPVDKTTGVRFDQTVVTVGFYARRNFPTALRRIGYRDAKTGKTLVFLTNNFTVPALIITQLYQSTPLADRTVLQMAQATSADQSLLRHQPQRGAPPNLERHRCLPARGSVEKTSASGNQSLHNSTDSQSHAVRENAHFSSL